MDQRKPKLLKRPIKTKNTRVTPTHDPTSEMHRAIAMGDKDWVKKLLDKGETLCNKGSIGIRRINCFNLAHSVGTWEFVKFLLSVDPAAGVKATNCDGLTLLMLYAKEHKIKEFEYVLKRGSYPDDCCVDGSTALMLALSKCYPPTVYEMSQKWDALYIQRRQSYKEKCQYIVDSLIQRGADVDICDINRENALHIAVKNRYTFHLEILQSLANEGVDHTTENKEHCTVLSYAMETFVELCLQFRKVTLAREVYPTLQFIFDFGSFRVDSFQLRCDVEMHPQTILLKHLNLCQMLTGKKSIFVDLIGSNKNLLNPDLIVLNYVLQNDTIECTKLPFAPLAHYLNYYQYTIDYNFPTQFNSIMENLQYLLSVGFSANVQETISPLTIGLLHRYPHFNYVVFAKCMLNSGVHVEQRLLKYRVLDEFDEELERLSAELCLPDVLRLTLSQNVSSNI
ncbi:hypothetical protein B566_EDAN012036 [Ephemera danica]|nr:hypothetical protein B566_EDAN012036 [Ephemera danica]